MTWWSPTRLTSGKNCSSPIKPYLESAYRAYHGMADLYVYFYELGLRLLKPGGLLSYVVTNKWMKSGYAEPLRRFFQDEAWIESVVDFGHAKQIFEEVDVFPSIIVARRPTDAPKPDTARLCTIPREQLRIDDLSRQIEREGVELPLSQLGADAWQLEPAGVNALLAKIQGERRPTCRVCRGEALSWNHDRLQRSLPDRHGNARSDCDGRSELRGDHKAVCSRAGY